MEVSQSKLFSDSPPKHPPKPAQLNLISVSLFFFWLAKQRGMRSPYLSILKTLLSVFFSLCLPLQHERSAGLCPLVPPTFPTIRAEYLWPPGLGPKTLSKELIRRLSC